MIRKSFSVGVMFCAMFAASGHAQRTVSSSERGLYYSMPYTCYNNYNCTNWAGVGAYLGQFNSQTYWNAMEPSALKLVHGRLQHFASFDDWTEALFPYAQLAQYDAAEVAAGRPSLFVHASYAGKVRPVLWKWYGVTTSPYNTPGRAVNLKDDRFAQFWVNQYIRPWLQKINKPNVVVLLDNCTFGYNLYGVNDDYGNFRPGVTWNYPYAQNQTDFLNSVNNFVLRVRQLDPSIRMVCNTDASGSLSEFLASFQNLDGISIESMEYYYQGSDAWWRSAFHNQYQNAAWMGSAGKIGLMIWQIPSDSTMTFALRRAYMHYLMVRGDNFFFAPQFGHNEVPPSYYGSMQTAIGLPTAPTVVTQEAGRTTGFALYSRQTAGGIAYLNWTGVTKTIVLPTNRAYLNSAGQPVTQITIPDRSGDYVLFAGGPVASAPVTNSGVSVTLTAPANGASYPAPATINFAATASTSSGYISRVEFYQGANKLGEDLTAPYTWTQYNVPAGSYSGQYAFTARAISSTGAAATSNAVAATVGSTSNLPPVVSLTAPANGAVYGAPATITLTASASDSNGIARVEFYQGANKLGEDLTAPYTWTQYNVPAGDYSGGYAFTARAVDNLGLTATSSPVAVRIGTTANHPPVVTLLSPTSGAIYTAPAAVTISVNASDPDGWIAKVEFYQGANKLGERTAPPYSWTQYSVPVGSYTETHAFAARVIDNSGAASSVGAAVTVR